MKVVEIINNITDIKFIGKFADESTDYFSNEIMKRAVSIYYPENFSINVLYIGDRNSAIKFYNQYKEDHRIIYNPEYYNIPENEEDIENYRSYIWRMNKEDYHQWRVDHIDNYRTPEFRAKCSENSHGEKNPMYGKKHSKESRQLMSENRKGLAIGEKNGNYGNTGDKAKNGKAVYKYQDPEHKMLLQRYNTVQLCLDDLGLKGHSNLMKAIKENKLYKGYYWSK